MRSDRWRQIEVLYHEALEREPEKRGAFLIEACQGDEGLRAEVEILLRQDSSLLDQPAWEAFSSSIQDPAHTILARGAKLGPYEIERLLGAGGMGQVYKARDTRLGRHVAVKVLTEEFSSQFEREARAISALNHPNICTLHDVGPNYLVMELVEGPTLAERMSRGAAPLEEALEIAWQVAGALQAAHDRGIIHRDLKPANIKITPDGVVKVLDFGLAKVVSAAAAHSTDSTGALTITEAGTVVGTPSYMAPEQARGKPADKRADIWAFGAVLYEMLTGQRLFQSETASDTLAQVLTKEPEWKSVPPKVEGLLRRCLERDPKERLRDIGDARFLLEDSVRKPAAAPGGALPWKIGTAVLAALLVAALVLRWPWTRRATPSVLRLNVDLGEGAAVSPERGPSMALSPDGSRLVFVIAKPAARSQLAVLRLDQSSKPLLLAGTDGAEAPFFSADGKSIAFFADEKLKKMDIAGGAPVTLCDAPSQRGGSWGDDDYLVFAPTNQAGLSRVSASGGAPQPVTEVDPKRGEWAHRYPQVLPGARAILFTNSGNDTGEGRIDVQSIPAGKHKTLVQSGAYGHYLPGGYLLYIHRDTLFAAPMDLDRLELTGPPVQVLEDVSLNSGSGAAGFTFSESGIFAYAAAGSDDRNRLIGVMDETGKVEPLPIPRARYVRARISPDGTRLAVAIEETTGTHLWIYEWRGQRLARFPFQNGNATNPVWTANGKYLVFSSDAQTPGPGIYWMRADGVGEARRLVEGPGLLPTSVSSQAGILYEAPAGPTAGLWILPVDWSEAANPRPGIPEHLPAPSMESPASLSPDGRWLVYVNAKLGWVNVFVRPFRRSGGPWQISSVAGTSAVWSSKGNELFYRSIPDFRIMVTTYAVDADSFSPAQPRPWSASRVDRFDLMPDGKHAVVVRPPSRSRRPMRPLF
jgi:serine/threonine-protein kinase